MHKIGLTGGIASGKSTAANVLKSLGAAVIDADEAARNVVMPGSEGIKKIAACFGESMVRKDGSLDRLRLGAAVFADDGALKRLNGILHPLIRRELELMAKDIERAQPDGVLVMDVPLLIECGWHTDVDEVWLVTAPEDVRVRRIMQRNGLNEAAARQRIAAQMTDEEKLPYADRVIVNGDDIKKFESEVAALYGALTVAYGKKTEKEKDHAEDSCGVSCAVRDDGSSVHSQPRAGKKKI